MWAFTMGVHRVPGPVGAVGDSSEPPKTPGLGIPGAHGVMSAGDTILVIAGEGDIIGEGDVVECRVGGDSVAQDWARAMKDDRGQWLFSVHVGRITVSARVRRGGLVSEPSPPQTIEVLGKDLAELCLSSPCPLHIPPPPPPLFVAPSFCQRWTLRLFVQLHPLSPTSRGRTTLGLSPAVSPHMPCQATCLSFDLPLGPTRRAL